LWINRDTKHTLVHTIVAEPLAIMPSSRGNSWGNNKGKDKGNGAESGLAQAAQVLPEHVFSERVSLDRTGHQTGPHDSIGNTCGHLHKRWIDIVDSDTDEEIGMEQDSKGKCGKPSSKNVQHHHRIGKDGRHYFVKVDKRSSKAVSSTMQCELCLGTPGAFGHISAAKPHFMDHTFCNT
jgi:hypothetical protein